MLCLFLSLLNPLTLSLTFLTEHRLEVFEGKILNEIKIQERRNTELITAEICSFNIYPADDKSRNTSWIIDHLFFDMWS